MIHKQYWKDVKIKASTAFLTDYESQLLNN